MGKVCVSFTFCTNSLHLYISRPTQISSLCYSLEDKMKSRSYFYKSSTMISEGILTIVSNSRLEKDDFTTDLNIQGVKLDRRLFDL